ncbi:uncharacterized protein LOC126634149 [Malus sylvestris]|uniref:uncharacterized protein LOC126634149 n=1 Tax=Malus sylvestris TaxID=3752 RepID=UPI0021ACDFC0|nr:uncharacterized protein LOC126634149 [Malus sylvestris]
MEQFRRLTRELRETKKTAEEALKKAEARNVVEDVAGTKRQRAEEEDKEGSSSSAPSSNCVEVTKNQGEGGYSGKGSKKVKDVDLREQIEKIVKGYKPQTPTELALEAARGIRKSPFTEDILKAKKPAKFTQPKFRLFEGTTDPVEHIYHFQQQMALEGDDEALLCKLFPSSLSGSSLTWFRQLKSRSIESFTNLCEAFISQYVCNRRPRKDVTILFSTKQNVGESLKSYMTRFTEEMSTLEECDSHTAVLAFREGVLPGTKMRRSLIETPPLDMREVMARADGIIRLEEEELIQSKRATATIAASPADTTALTLKPTAQPRQERRFSRDPNDGFSERSRLDRPTLS